VVWVCEEARKHWAAMHVVARHGGLVEGVVVLEVQVPKSWLKKHGGKAAGLYRCIRDVPVRCIRKVIGFGELSASPVK
jgi:hypothetical protein